MSNKSSITFSQLCGKPASSDYWKMPNWLNAKSNYQHLMQEDNTINEIKKLKTGTVGNFLAGVIVAITGLKQSTNVTLTLKDPSGEIRAFCPKSLYNAHIDDMQRKSVIILRNFRLLSFHNTGNSYIMLKVANVEAIWPPRNNAKICVNHFTHVDDDVAIVAGSVNVNDNRRNKQKIRFTVENQLNILQDISLEIDFDNVNFPIQDKEVENMPMKRFKVDPTRTSDLNTQRQDENVFKRPTTPKVTKNQATVKKMFDNDNDDISDILDNF